MTVDTLAAYLENKISAEELSNDLEGTIEKMSHDNSRVHIKDSDSYVEFKVDKDHLCKILTDTLIENLSFDDLKAIAACFMFSNFFTWDSDTETGKRISDIIFELDNPEINFPITHQNIKLWIDFLENGNHNLINK